MNTDVMFSSQTSEWETPKDFFEKLDAQYHFNLDVCASPENAKCKEYIGKKLDGLRVQWYGRCWMNPPYGREIELWVKKAYESVRDGWAELVVCLLPACTDTRWFHGYCLKGEVQFIRGRLKFGNSRNSAPFPSMLVIFRRDAENIRSCRSCRYHLGGGMCRLELRAECVKEGYKAWEGRR